MLKHIPLHYLLASVLFVTFIITGYSISRDQTGPLLVCYLVLFVSYLAVIRRSDELEEDRLNFWIIASLLFRASLLFSIPALSDDFYRFIWDGRVLAAGANPFSEVPSYYMDSAHSLPGLDQNLYDKLNSKHRFSSYPPVCQFIYWISVKLSPDSIHGSVIVMKNILLLFEVGTLWTMKRLLTFLKLPTGSILIYALNPLVILEVSGNGHFEGVMIFFFLAAVLSLLHNRKTMSAVSYALSVCTKLIPLVFLPLLWHPLGKQRVIRYWLITGGVVLLLYLPLLSADIIENYATSLGYYFQRFEFNASIYYLIRGLGYLIFGFNIIHYAGPVLAIIAAAIILKISFRPTRLNYTTTIDPVLFKGMVWCLLIYLLSSPIVHPWYILTLLALSIFAGYRFPVAWTGLIFLTYAGYSESGYNENFFIITVEYIGVASILLYETLWRPQPDRY